MARRTETRDGAVQRYGSYWHVQGGESSSVQEILGKSFLINSEFEFPLDKPKAAAQKARDLRASSARGPLERAEYVLGRMDNRIHLRFAKLGLHRRAAAILAGEAKFRTQAAQCRSILADNETYDPVFTLLPSELCLPAPIDVGTPVWEVGYEWPIEYGILLRECRVAEVKLYGEMGGRSGYDHSIRYLCERVAKGPGTPASDPVFEYDHDDLSDPVIACGTNSGSRLFLTRDAAEIHLREVAAMVEEKMRAAVATFCHPQA